MIPKKRCKNWKIEAYRTLRNAPLKLKICSFQLLVLVSPQFFHFLHDIHAIVESMFQGLCWRQHQDMTKDILVSQDHHWRLQFLDHSFPCFQIVHNTKLNLYQQLDNIIIFKLESHHSMSIIEIYPQINHIREAFKNDLQKTYGIFHMLVGFRQF